MQLSRENHFMHRAVELSKKALTGNKGGPFGAIVVKKDEIVGSGYNQVLSTNDPTAHAEMLAIRDASKYLKRFDLKGCEIYCSCEPCPMCLGAIYWSHISRVFYANSRLDAEDIGFDDSFIYREFQLAPAERKVHLIRLPHPHSLAVFRDWAKKNKKTPY